MTHSYGSHSLLHYYNFLDVLLDLKLMSHSLYLLMMLDKEDDLRLRDHHDSQV